MPTGFHKTIQTYFSKITKLTPPRHHHHPKDDSNPTTNSSSNSSSSHSAEGRNSSWLLSACRYPKTQSFAVRSRSSHDVDPAAGIHHFNSLFLTDDSDHQPEFTSISAGSHTTTISGLSSDSIEIPPDLVSAIASSRFFVSPGTSNSLYDHDSCSNINSTDHHVHTATTTTTPPDTAELVGKEQIPAEADKLIQLTSSPSPPLVGDGIAVTTLSPDPFYDFRQSMEEMVKARAQEKSIDWEFLQELFFCYLKLNHPRDHKYILSAFADLLATLSIDKKHDQSRPDPLSDRPDLPTSGRRRRKKPPPILTEKTDECN